MRGLYESILGDFDTNIAASDDMVATLDANKKDSELRDLFGIYSGCENPFEIEKNILHINAKEKGMRFNQKLTWDAPGNTDKSVKSIFGRELDMIWCPSSVTISGKMNRFKDVYAKAITIGDLELHCEDSKIEDIKILASATNGCIGSMTFYSQKPIEFNNVMLGFTSTYGGANPYFTRIPVFKNTKITGANRICIEVPLASANMIDPKSIWDDKRFNDIFDFDYNLEVKDSGKSKTIKIKDIKSLRQLVTAGKFYDRDYDQWPYKIKSTAKITDFIDISGSNDVNYINISDRKFGILFENVKSGQSAYFTYFEDMLKAEQEFLGNYGRDNIDKYNPRTADGWRVILYRC